MWKSCEEYVKSMWKTETMCEIKVGNTTADTHMDVKLSECIWKLFWNFFNTMWNCFYTSETIFQSMWNFISQQNFTGMKQFSSVCEIFPHMWNNFVLRVNFFLHMWNNLVMYVKFFHAHELHVMYVKIFSHTGNSFVMHAIISAREMQSTQELGPNDCGNVPCCHQVDSTGRGTPFPQMGLLQWVQ